jgi:DnaJ-class molecular chaperone
MNCPDCNGSGAVMVYNTRDDSGDYPEICGTCNGHGFIALTNDGPNKV